MYVIDIAWQSVPYGLYSTEPSGRSPEGEGYISYTARDWYDTGICIIYPNCILAKGGGTCALLGSNRQHRRCVLSTRVLVLQDDKLYWCILAGTV